MMLKPMLTATAVTAALRPASAATSAGPGARHAGSRRLARDPRRARHPEGRTGLRAPDPGRVGAARTGQGGRRRQADAVRRSPSRSSTCPRSRRSTSSCAASPATWRSIVRRRRRRSPTASRFDRLVVLARATTPVRDGQRAPAAGRALAGAPMHAARRRRFLQPSRRTTTTPRRSRSARRRAVRGNASRRCRRRRSRARTRTPIRARPTSAPTGSRSARTAATRPRPPRPACTSAPPETQFDYANPQKYFEQRAAPAAGQRPTGGPDRGAEHRRRRSAPHGRTTGADQRRRPASRGAGTRRGRASRRRRRRRRRRAGRVLQPLQPAGRLGAAAAGDDAAGTPVEPDRAKYATRTTRRSRPKSDAVRPSPCRGEYAERGDYHRAPDAAWDYLPTYLAKLAHVRRWLERAARRRRRVLDAGCGEGVLVEEFAGRLAIEGLDANYSSAHVTRGSLLELPFAAGRFDRALCLDVLEHLAYEDQPHGARRAAPRARAGRRAAGLGAEPRAPAVAGPLPADRTPDSHGERGEAPGRSAARGVPAGCSIAPASTSSRERGVFPTVPVLTAWIRRKPADRAWLHTRADPACCRGRRCRSSRSSRCAAAR